MFVTENRKKKMDEIYRNLMLLASGIVATLSIMIVALRIPKRPELEKFRNARTIFAVAGFLLAALNFACFLVGYVPPFDRMAILATAPYEALLMTGTVLIFINPERVTMKCVVREFLIISVLVSAMYLIHWKFPDIFQYVYVALGIAFLGQIISYTTIFVKSYKRAVKLTSEYYAEDYAPRIIWVFWMFVFVLISALACFICLFIGGWGYCVLVPIYLCTYNLFAVRMTIYATDNSYITSALHSPSQTEEEDDVETDLKQQSDISEETAEEVKEKLSQWVSKKKFMERDVSYADVLFEIGIEVSLLRRYMKDRLGTDFRTWRNGLRLEEACRMFSENPCMSIEQVSDKVGYNDSSNFHKDFKKRYGMSASAYKKTKQKAQ